MTVTEYEAQQIKFFYSVGVISKEDYEKLMNDIAILLLDEFYMRRWH